MNQFAQEFQDMSNAIRHFLCCHDYKYRQRVIVHGEAILIFECKRCGRLCGEHVVSNE